MSAVSVPPPPYTAAMQASSALLCILAGASIFMLIIAARKLPNTMRSKEAPPEEGPAPDTDEQADPSSLTEEYCLHWLKHNMPDRDRGLITEEQLRTHVRLALAARSASTWAAAVPVKLWLNDVLPYRSVDEPLDTHDWRPLFVERFIPLVAEASSLADAAQILNRCAAHCGWHPLTFYQHA